MDATMHEISYSFDGLDAPFNSLLLLLQRRLREQQRSKGARDAVVRHARTIVIVDGEATRGQSLANFLHTAGYQVVLTTNMLDAFTAYLQGRYIPFALIMGSDDKANHLFLQRLLQQIQQRYDWELLLVRFQFVQRASFADSLTVWPDPPAPAQPEQSPRMALPSSEALPYFNPAPVTNGRSSLRRPGQNTLLPLISPAPASTFPEQYRQELARQATQPLRELVQGEEEPLYRLVSEKRSSEYEQRSGALLELPAPLAQNEQAAPEVVAPVGLKKRVTLSGQKMGRFQVGMRLGAGPSSDVYQVYDLLREQESTMKAVQIDAVPFLMMDKSLEDITIFQREAELLSRIPHEGIVPLLNCSKSYTSGSPFAYKNMPLYSEGSLRSWLQRDRRTGAFVLDDILAVLNQLVEVLQYAHDHQVLHQNLKFSNILVSNKTKDIRKLRVVLSDFSYVQDGSLFPGTRDLLYAAPENWEGIVGETSDQYALAAITYELLTGRPPFQGNSEHVMRILHTSKQPQLPTTLNPRLEPSINGVLMKALAKRPKDRYSSVKMFLAALQNQRQY